MQKRTLILSLVIGLGIFSFFGCNHHRNHRNELHQSEVKKVVYTCEMDADVVSDKPGKCPKCGMDLVKKEIRSDEVRK